MVTPPLTLAVVVALGPAARPRKRRRPTTRRARGRTARPAGHLAGAQHRRVGPRGSRRTARRARRATASSRAARSRISRAALAKKQENAQNRATLDPENKCYLPGVPRITYMPYPFRIVQQRDKITILYEYLGAMRFLYMNGNPHPEGPDRVVHGRLARRAGRATRWSSTSCTSPIRPGSIAPGTSTATRCTWSSATRRPGRITCSTKRRSRIRRCSRGPGRSACRCTAVRRRTPSCSNTSVCRTCSTRHGTSRRVPVEMTAGGSRAKVRARDHDRCRGHGRAWLRWRSQPVSGQARWDPKTPKLPMAKTWVAYKATLPPYTPPRTPDGVPDLQGTWGGPGGAGGDDIEEHEYVDATTPPQESFVSDPADGKIPYTPWALAKRNEIRAGLSRGWPGENGERLYADPATYCVTMIGPQRQRRRDHPAARPRHDGDGEGPPRDPDRWAPARECHREVLARQPARPLGGRYARRRRDGTQRPALVRQRRQLLHREHPGWSSG